MSSRKHEEREFHDRLRTEAFEQRWTPEAEARTGTDPQWANFKYYAVERRSLDYARAWLQREAVGRTVLDYGCGNGEESLFAARHGAARVVGIDISEVSIKNCRLRAERDGLMSAVDFRVNDGEALEFADNTFDVAMEYGVLHHVDLDAAMRELARVLKPSGRMICTEALGHNPIIQAYRRRTPTCARSGKSSTSFARTRSPRWAATSAASSRDFSIWRRSRRCRSGSRRSSVRCSEFWRPRTRSCYGRRGSNGTRGSRCFVLSEPVGP
jgi:SAM-dependent methyltransferase